MDKLDALAAVAAAPLDPAAHERLGDAWREAGANVRSQACYRTALYLGGSDPALTVKLAVTLLHLGRVEAAASLLEALADVGDPDAGIVPQLCEVATRTASKPLTDLGHNRFLQMRTLAAEIRRLHGSDSAAVVDVGGGDGALALFLPGDAYFLAEPATNGLSGPDLPLPADSADVVCACHVLEHIPPAGRDAFLDRLLAVSRRHVLLLNPFAAPGVDDAARLRLVRDLTGAAWAREHLECALPTLDEVRDYAERRNVGLAVRPHGAVGTSFTVTMLRHFADEAGRGADAARIEAYLNGLADEHLTCPGLPSGWLIHLDRQGPPA